MEQQPHNKDRLKEITDSIERGIQELFESDAAGRFFNIENRGYVIAVEKFINFYSIDK